MNINVVDAFAKKFEKILLPKNFVIREPSSKCSAPVRVVTQLRIKNIKNM